MEKLVCFIVTILAMSSLVMSQCVVDGINNHPMTNDYAIVNITCGNSSFYGIFGNTESDLTQILNISLTLKETTITLEKELLDGLTGIITKEKTEINLDTMLNKTITTALNGLVPYTIPTRSTLVSTIPIINPSSSSMTSTMVSTTTQSRPQPTSPSNTMSYLSTTRPMTKSTINTKSTEEMSSTSSYPSQPKYLNLTQEHGNLVFSCSDILCGSKQTINFGDYYIHHNQIHDIVSDLKGDSERQLSVNQFGIAISAMIAILAPLFVMFVDYFCCGFRRKNKDGNEGPSTYITEFEFSNNQGAAGMSEYKIPEFLALSYDLFPMTDNELQTFISTLQRETLVISALYTGAQPRHLISSEKSGYDPIFSGTWSDIAASTYNVPVMYTTSASSKIEQLKSLVEATLKILLTADNINDFLAYAAQFLPVSMVSVLRARGFFPIETLIKSLHGDDVQGMINGLANLSNALETGNGMSGWTQFSWAGVARPILMDFDLGDTAFHGLCLSVDGIVLGILPAPRKVIERPRTILPTLQCLANLKQANHPVGCGCYLHAPIIQVTRILKEIERGTTTEFQRSELRNGLDFLTDNTIEDGNVAKRIKQEAMNRGHDRKFKLSKSQIDQLRKMRDDEAPLLHDFDNHAEAYKIVPMSENILGFLNMRDSDLRNKHAKKQGKGFWAIGKLQPGDMLELIARMKMEETKLKAKAKRHDIPSASQVYMNDMLAELQEEHGNEWTEV